MHYLLNFHSGWSLLLVNIQDIVYTVNKVTHRKHHFTTSCGIWNRMYNFLSKVIPTSYYTNKGEVENVMVIYSTVTWRITVHDVTLHAPTSYHEWVCLPSLQSVAVWTMPCVHHCHSISVDTLFLLLDSDNLHTGFSNTVSWGESGEWRGERWEKGRSWGGGVEKGRGERVEGEMRKWSKIIYSKCITQYTLLKT